MYYLLPDIGNIIKGVFVTILEWIMGVFIGIFNGLVSDLKDLITSTPYPNDSGGDAVIFNPRSAASTGDLNGIWSDLLNPSSGAAFYDTTVVPIAVTLFLLAFSLAYVAKIFEGMPAVAQFKPDLSKVFFLFIVTLVWLQIMTGALVVADSVGGILANTVSSSTDVCGGGTGSSSPSNQACDKSGGTNSSALVTVILGIILFFTASIMMLLGALLWAFRYLLLFTLGITMPIILAFKAFEEVELPFVEDFADLAWELFWFAAFANIPASLVFLVGGIVSDVAGEFGGSLLTDMLSVMITAALPLVAVFAPFYFLKNTQAGAQVVQAGSGVASAGAAVASGGTTAAAAGLTEAANELADEESSTSDVLKAGAGAAGVNALNEMTDENSLGRRVWQGQRKARNAAGAVGAASRGEDPAEALGQESYLEKYDRTGELKDPDEREEEDADVATEFADVVGSGVQRGRQMRVGDEGAGDDIERMAKLANVQDEDDVIQEATALAYDSNDFRTMQRRLARAGIDAEDLLDRGYDGEYADDLDTVANTGMSADEVQAIREFTDIDSVSRSAITNNANDLLQNDDVLDAVGGRSELEGFIQEAQETTVKSSLREAGDQLNLQDEEIDQLVQNTSAESMSDLADMNAERLASEVPWGIDEDRAGEIVGYAQQEMVLEQFEDAGVSVDRALEGNIREMVGNPTGYDVDNMEELLGKYAAAGGSGVDNIEEFMAEAGVENASASTKFKVQSAMEEQKESLEQEVEFEREVTPDGTEQVAEALDVDEDVAERVNQAANGGRGSAEPDYVRKVSDEFKNAAQRVAREQGAGDIAADTLMQARAALDDGDNVTKQGVVNELVNQDGVDRDTAEDIANIVFDEDADAEATTTTTDDVF